MDRPPQTPAEIRRDFVDFLRELHPLPYEPPREDVDAMWRAWATAVHNGYAAIRWVIGRRMWKRLVGPEPRSGPASIWSIPAELDETAEDGFGLVTRPPAA